MRTVGLGKREVHIEIAPHSKAQGDELFVVAGLVARHHEGRCARWIGARMPEVHHLLDPASLNISIGVARPAGKLWQAAGYAVARRWQARIAVSMDGRVQRAEAVM